jgi:predicted transposase/invertase (TIGR01784 family)
MGRVEQGFIEGFEKGKKEGIEHGIEQGKKKEKLEIAKNMIQKNIAFNLIKESCGI